MKLKDLLQEVDYVCLHGEDDREISTICYDSREVQRNCLFVCMQGRVVDGHEYMEEAYQKGAIAFVVSKEVDVNEVRINGRLWKDTEVVLIRVKDTRLALAFLSAAFFRHPARELKTIGITGTKGKTTTTYLMKSILENAGRKVGLLGTVEIIIGKERIPAPNTTVESFLLQKYFRMMVDAGLDTVVMEVSSQGLKMHRTKGFVFDIGVFTNLAQDHIGPGEHESFEDYVESKSMLFRQCKIGIVNGDDAFCGRVLQGHTCKVETYGLKPENDLRASRLELQRNKDVLGISFVVEGNMDFATQMALPGKFSVYNALAAIAVCRHFTVREDDIDRSLRSIKVKGRVESVKVSSEYVFLIDYAHNAMALQNVLGTLREYEPERLICIFGCGGNRSKQRRYEMGRISGEMADLSIITSDNPRFEKPEDIIEEILVGIKKTQGEYVVIPDRKEAIAYAIREGKKGDIIVLAGKGHEEYQEIEGKKYPMKERGLIQEIVDSL